MPRKARKQKNIPLEALMPQINELINLFKEKLAACPEFVGALTRNYLTNQENLHKVSFVRGEYRYFVYCVGEAELTGDNPEWLVKSRAGRSGWKTLNIERQPDVVDPKKVFFGAEGINMHIGPEDEREDTKAAYGNNIRSEDKEINTENVLRKVREILDSF